MTKKGPLSTAEQFYIKEKHKNVGLEEICKELDRPKASVKRHIIKCLKDEETLRDQEFTVGSQFATRNGTVVMTENASMMSDTIKGTKTITSRESSCITSTKKS